jgi:hypothetical protein
LARLPGKKLKGCGFAPVLLNKGLLAPVQWSEDGWFDFGGGDLSLPLPAPSPPAPGRDLPPQWLVFAGGPWSAPGYDWHAFASRALLSQRLEVRTPIPAPSIPLRRFGKSPPHATLAPFVQAVAVASGTAARPTMSGVYPSAGVSVLFFYDLLRADVARGVRDGAWRFSIDIDRSFWGIL